MGELITLGQALAMLCKPHQTHSVEYRKVSGDSIGDYGCKEGVTLHTANGNNHFLNATKKMGGDGQIKLWQPKGGHTFDLVIDCILSVDGMIIQHPFS
jgi:hypothetical protein